MCGVLTIRKLLLLRRATCPAAAARASRRGSGSARQRGGRGCSAGCASCWCRNEEVRVLPLGRLVLSLTAVLLLGLLLPGSALNPRILRPRAASSGMHMMTSLAHLLDLGGGVVVKSLPSQPAADGGLHVVFVSSSSSNEKASAKAAAVLKVRPEYVSAGPPAGDPWWIIISLDRPSLSLLLHAAQVRSARRHEERLDFGQRLGREGAAHAGVSGVRNYGYTQFGRLGGHPPIQQINSKLPFSRKKMGGPAGRPTSRRKPFKASSGCQTHHPVLIVHYFRVLNHQPCRPLFSTPPPSGPWWALRGPPPFGQQLLPACGPP